MDIDLSKLKRIEIEDFPILEEYLKNKSCNRSAYNAVNLCIWGSQLDAHYLFIDGRLIVHNKAWNCLLLPCESLYPPDILKEVSAAFYDSGRCGRVAFVNKDYVDKYCKELECFDIYLDRNNADYIYLAEKLVTLSGKKLQKKKNLISQFMRLYPNYSVSEITPDDFNLCLEQSENWISDHHRQHPGYKLEKKAIYMAFNNYERFKLQGKKIMVDGEMVAFSVSSVLNDDMALVHFEKYDREKKGAAQVINWEMAKELNRKHTYINREEDMGVEQLRQAKRSYQPIKILNSYVLERKKERGNPELGDLTRIKGIERYS